MGRTPICASMHKRERSQRRRPCEPLWSRVCAHTAQCTHLVADESCAESSHGMARSEAAHDLSRDRARVAALGGLHGGKDAVDDRLDTQEIQTLLGQSARLVKAEDADLARDGDAGRVDAEHVLGGQALGGADCANLERDGQERVHALVDSAGAERPLGDPRAVGRVCVCVCACVWVREVGEYFVRECSRGWVAVWVYR